MKRLLKFLHTVGSIGFGGAAAAMLIAATHLPAIEETAAFVSARSFLHTTARGVLLPCMMVTVISGLLAIAIHRPFHNAGWVWAKAIMVIWIIEGTLGGILGPAELGL